MADLDVLELVRLVWRRKIVLLVPILLGVGVALAAYSLVPPRYRASTTIMVEEQKVPSTYVKSTVTADTRQRLQTIRQQVTSRDRLQTIIEELDPYPDLRGQVSAEGLVSRMRSDLWVDVERNAIFRIWFSGSSPETVAAVANRVAELFIEENLRLREGQAKNTVSFLEDAAEAKREELEAQEERVAEFRGRNRGRLPEQKDVILKAISQQEARLNVVQEQLSAAQLRRQVMRSSSSADILIEEQVPTQPERLRQLRLELVELRSQFTDRHPDVVRLRREIESLESQLTFAPPAVSQPSPRIDPALQAEIGSLDGDIERLQAEREQALTEMGLLQSRLEAIPRVEQEILNLTRDYDNLAASYESLKSKLLEAQLAERLEASQQSEQFNILERAIPPGRPHSPNRRNFLGMGLMLGAALGFGLVMVREKTDKVIRDVETLRREFPRVPVLASIPHLGGLSRKGSESWGDDERRTA